MRIKLSVDAGMVGILTAEFIKKNGGIIPKDRHHSRFLSGRRRKGIFYCTLESRSTWIEGKVAAEGPLKTDIGFYVGDPCYCWSGAGKRIH